MATESLFEIRITGENVLPSNFKSKDLAEVIVAVEKAIASLVANDYSDFDIEDIAVGLTQVQEGSVVLQFSSPVPNVVLPAYLKTAEAISHQRFDELPIKTLAPIKDITRISRRKNYAFEFRDKEDRSVANSKWYTLATITPETEIVPQPYLIGSTTIHGKVMRVGGKNEQNPRVILDTGGEIINCKIDKKLASSISRQLGRKLYQWVGVYGTAKWNPTNLVTEEFVIERLSEYEDVSLVSAFEELANVVGDAFKGIDDVERYVGSLRNDEDWE